MSTHQSFKSICMHTLDSNAGGTRVASHCLLMATGFIQYSTCTDCRCMNQLKCVKIKTISLDCSL